MEDIAPQLVPPSDQAHGKELTTSSLNDMRSPQSLLLDDRQRQCMSPSSVQSTSASERNNDSVLYNYNDLRTSLNGVDSDISSISPSPKLPHHHITRGRDSPSKFTIHTRASRSPKLSIRSSSDLLRSDTPFSMSSTTLSSDMVRMPELPNDGKQTSEIFGDLSNVDEYIMTSPMQHRPPTPPCNLLNVPRSMSVNERDTVPSPVSGCRISTLEEPQLSDNTMDEELSNTEEDTNARAYHFRNHSFTSGTTPRKRRYENAKFMARSASFIALETCSERLSATKEPTSPLVSSLSVTGSAPLIDSLHERDHCQRGAYSECAGDSHRTTNTYVLPNKEKDLGHRFITPETFHDLSLGKFSDKITSINVVDCRSVEEYTAGHIVNAVNIPVPHNKSGTYSCMDDVQEALEKTFFPPASNAQTTAVVFYCEFSSYRGPTGAMKMKNLDSSKLQEQNCRAGSSARHYPQVYVLEGGYNSFFKKFPDDCFPRNYLPESVAHPQRTLRYNRSFNSVPERLIF